MAWPLRLSSQGMIIGFLGEPSKPMVDASGIPSSMCVPWMSPFDSESRMAAQLAPLMMVELMPYFLNRPFSWAITTGELSVRAMMPKRRSGVSGLLLEATEEEAAAEGAGAADASDLMQFGKSAAAPMPSAPSMKVLRGRLLLCVMSVSSENEGQIELDDLVGGVLHRFVQGHGEGHARAEPALLTNLEMGTRSDGPGRRVAQRVLVVGRVALNDPRRRQPALVADLGAQRELWDDEVAEMQARREVGLGLVELHVLTTHARELQQRRLDLRSEAACHVGETHARKHGEVVHGEHGV